MLVFPLVVVTVLLAVSMARNVPQGSQRPDDHTMQWWQQF